MEGVYRNRMAEVSLPRETHSQLPASRQISSIILSIANLITACSVSRRGMSVSSRATMAMDLGGHSSMFSHICRIWEGERSSLSSLRRKFSLAPRFRW